MEAQSASAHQTAEPIRLASFGQAFDRRPDIDMKTVLKLIVTTLAATLPIIAQQPVAVTTADYQRAEKWMGYNTNPLVFRAGIRPTWQGDGRFWYRVTTPEGSEFIMVDTATGAKSPAFDQAKLAAALSSAASSTFDAHRLPFTDFEMSDDQKSILLTAQRRRWKCDVIAYQCTADNTPQPAGQRPPLGGRGGAAPDVTSPDKEARGFHPRLQPLGARRGNGQGDATHD